jgi:hypothetical protein
MCNIDIEIRGLEKPTSKEFKNWFDYLHIIQNPLIEQFIS